MKTLLLTLCISGALFVASAAPSSAANFRRVGEYTLTQTEDCQTSCKAKADSCRTQCSDPEEQEQCIIGCDSSACKTNCDTFEDACKQRCQNPG